VFLAKAVGPVLQPVRVIAAAVAAVAGHVAIWPIMPQTFRLLLPPIFFCPILP